MNMFLQERYALAASLFLFARTLQDGRASGVIGERNALRAWALEQFIQGEAFNIENLPRQLGVSLIQSLHAISLSISMLDKMPQKISKKHVAKSELASEDTSHCDSVNLLRKLASCIDENFIADIPFRAFLAISISFPVFHQGSFNEVEYMKSANDFCKQTAKSATLPLIAVCCFEGSLLERVLQSLCNSGCSLDDASPSTHVKELASQIDSQNDAHFSKKERASVCSEVVHRRASALRLSEANPLSFLVSRNNVEGVRLLLNLGARPGSVCIFIPYP